MSRWCLTVFEAAGSGREELESVSLHSSPTVRLFVYVKWQKKTNKKKTGKKRSLTQRVLCTGSGKQVLLRKEDLEKIWTD